LIKRKYIIRLIKLSKNNNLFINLLYDYFKELGNKKNIKKNFLIKFSSKKKNFLIKSDSSILGFICLSFFKGIKNNKICFINDFYIIKKYRRNYIASEVMKKIYAFYKKRKYEIRIEIMKHNFNALKFWKKFNIYLRSQTFIVK